MFFARSRGKNEIYSQITTQYNEHFRMAEDMLMTFFENIENDLLVLADNPIIKNETHSNFTTFLNANPETYVYNYSKEERDIIDLFNTYRSKNKFVNSVYMGRENGSFVRSHPRTAPTLYDPRERPWYILALNNPKEPLRTGVYGSVTNNDINIGTVKALVNSQNMVYGVIGIDVTLEDLSQKISRVMLGFNGGLALFDSNNYPLIYLQPVVMDTLKYWKRTLLCMQEKIWFYIKALIITI